MSCPTFLQLLRDVHAGQVGEHQDPGLQTVGIAERGLLLLHIDVSQLTDQLQERHERPFAARRTPFYSVSTLDRESLQARRDRSSSAMFVITCGTSMLSVGRMVASLLLRGSNSNAAVNTIANPEGEKKKLVNQNLVFS